MEKQSIFKKIDALYTKASKAIIGKISHDGDGSSNIQNDTQTKGILQSIKDVTQNNLTKIKQVGLKKTLLTMGTPPDEKRFLYTEVVKREKQEAKERAKIAREKTKKTKATASSSTKKKTATTTTNTSTQTNKAETKTTIKASTKKSVTKKTATKKPTKKQATSTTKKASSSTKKPTSKKTTETNSTTKKKSVTKTTATTKSITSKKASKREEKIALYIKDIKKHYGEVDEAFVAIIVKNLGPSIYRKDAELVSCSDPKELDTVRRNFLIKKLGIDASKGVLDAAIQDVCEELKGVRTKYRATFYYSLAKKFKKESVLS